MSVVNVPLKDGSAAVPRADRAPASAPLLRRSIGGVRNGVGGAGRRLLAGSSTPVTTALRRRSKVSRSKA